MGMREFMIEKLRQTLKYQAAKIRRGRSRASEVGLDLLSVQFQQNPYFYYHELRRLGPVHYLKKHEC